jgi:hypothetical protein
MPRNGFVMEQSRRLIRFAPGWSARVLAAILAVTSGGCAALTNPVATGIPVSRVPPEYLAQPKEDLKTIPLTVLRQSPPDAYRLGPGDVLGVYIEGILGDKSQPLPVRFPEAGSLSANLPPSVGYPIPIREDGTLPLPLVERPITVQGMTVVEAEEAIRKAYLFPKKLLDPGREHRILVSLQRQRFYRVQVVRQDTGALQFSGGLVLNQRRGTGAAIDLPAYENDVLNALNRTGGLPGLDALNEIIVEREVKGQGGTRVSRIPLRTVGGEPPPVTADDVILQNGDIVFVESRDTEVFYTGGFLLPRQFVLPRDYDLRVVEAVALANGPLVNGAVSQNNLSGTVTATGIGSPNPSRVTVLRRTKHNGQIPIIVNLNVALNDPRENLIIQPGDVIILQETIEEAVTRYLTTITHFNFFSQIIQGTKTNGSVTVIGP